MRDIRGNMKHAKIPPAETTSFPYGMLDDSYFIESIRIRYMAGESIVRKQGN